VSEALAAEVLSLPMYPRLTEALIDEVCAVIRGTLD
jgi:dTDP-4-amino-4,6-dideoxygalactose transaminase